MCWGCFAASGTGCLYRLHGIRKSEDYQRIQGCNVGHVRNHESYSRTMTQNTRQNTLRNGLRPARCPDLNPIEYSKEQSGKGTLPI